MTHYPFKNIDEDWSDKEVFIIGGGPSLKGFDFSVLDGLTIGVNKSAWVADADILLTVDQSFARDERSAIETFVRNGGRAFLGMPPNDTQHVPIDGVNYVVHVRGGGLSVDPERLFGVHSGYAAVNLAFLCGAKKINLLGLDMRYSSDGDTHFHGGSINHSRHTEKYYVRWAGEFDRAKPQLDEAGIAVVNYVGDPVSRLTAFETRPLEDLL